MIKNIKFAINMSISSCLILYDRFIRSVLIDIYIYMFVLPLFRSLEVSR